MRVAGFRHVALNFDFLRSPKRRGEHRGADWGRARAQWPRKAALLLDSGRVVLLMGYQHITIVSERLTKFWGRWVAATGRAAGQNQPALARRPASRFLPAAVLALNAQLRQPQRGALPHMSRALL